MSVMQSLRNHPVITGVMVGCTLGGVVVGMILIPEDWALWRRIAGGAISGAGVGLLITAFKMIG